MELVAGRTRQAVEKAKDGTSGGASRVADAPRAAGGEVKDHAGRVAKFVKEVETDAALKAKVAGITERSLDSAGDRVA